MSTKIEKRFSKVTIPSTNREFVLPKISAAEPVNITIQNKSAYEYDSSITTARPVKKGLKSSASDSLLKKDTSSARDLSYQES